MDELARVNMTEGVSGYVAKNKQTMQEALYDLDSLRAKMIKKYSSAVVYCRLYCK